MRLINNGADVNAIDEYILSNSPGEKMLKKAGKV